MIHHRSQAGLRRCHRGRILHGWTVLAFQGFSISTAAELTLTEMEVASKAGGKQSEPVGAILLSNRNVDANVTDRSRQLDG
jgi:hypothetical protein